MADATPAPHESVNVKTVPDDEMQEVIDTIVLAFATDPLIRWTFPNPHGYLEHFPEFVRIYCREAIDHGTAYSVGDFAGAALWHPPGVQPDDEELMAYFQGNVAQDKMEKWGMFGEKSEDCHPDVPSWNLHIIGVEPTQQRKGFGTALMKHALSRCDREEAVATLSTANPENMSLYIRHGFEIQ